MIRFQSALKTPSLNRPFHRIRLRFLLFPLMCLLAVSFLVVETFRGDRGIGNWMELRAKVAERSQALDQLREDNAMQLDRINRLRTETLDIDFLDELARQQLGLVHPSDRIILQTKRN
jgi:cell division protein FtsB